MFRKYVLPWVAWAVYRVWTASWRCELREPSALKALLAARTPVIFAHWHGDELAIIHLVGHYRIATMTSTSSDGQLVDFVIRRLGGATSKGSSTRGGVGALKGLVRLVRAGHSASMAVDGPKGPIHQVKPGVFELSRLGKVAIVPVAIGCDRAIVFEKSWNKARLPKPFARVEVVFGEPLPIVTPLDDIRRPEAAEALGRAISDASHQAAKLIAAPKGQC